MRLFIPHLRRATAIRRHLDAETTAAAAFDAVLDQLSSAVLLVDSDLHVIHANRAAEAMFSTADILRCHGGTLRLPSLHATTVLAAAVAEAAGNATVARKNTYMPIRGRGSNAHILHVLPLHRDHLRSGLSPGVMVAVFVAQVGPRPGACMEAMRLLFDLTPAEAAVLEQIAAGRAVGQTAQTLGIAVTTVKTHLQHLFDKTGVRRQAELVALVASLALPLRG